LQEVAFDCLAQWFAGSEQIFLADEFVEGARTHPFGERRGRARAGWLGVWKE
jgi:hypothetical protein